MRLPTAFYREFHAHRDDYGKIEYDVEDLIEKAIPILEKHLGDDAGRALELELLKSINDNIEARENDPRQGEIFGHDGHVPLGKRRRIKRGRMTSDQCFRRKLIIDENHKHQNSAWAVETSWLNETMAALRGLPLETKREDVLNEDGTVKVLELT